MVDKTGFATLLGSIDEFLGLEGKEIQVTVASTLFFAHGELLGMDHFTDVFGNELAWGEVAIGGGDG